MFTKEYIKECDCKEIQKVFWDFGDGDWILWNVKEARKRKYHLASIGNYNCELERFDRKKHDAIKIPLSHQLDEEIIKICKEKEYEYSSTYAIEWFCRVDKIGANIDFNAFNSNPLIAKIKLLKQLLKEDK